MDTIRTQLDQWRTLRGRPRFATRYSCLEDLVLREGFAFKPMPPRHQPWPKECFRRSFMIAGRRNSKWVYVEGYAINRCMGMACEHAWLTPADSPWLAYDVAWGRDDGLEYLGIPFRIEYVRRIFEASKRKTYGVIDSPWARWPLVTGEHTIEEARWLAA